MSKERKKGTYYDRNREKMLDYSKRYTENNKERKKTMNALWYKRNKEKKNRSSVQWRVSNPIKQILIRKVGNANGRASKFSLVDRLTVADLSELMPKYSMACTYCLCDLTNPETNGLWELDHIAPMSNGGPNIIDNIVICCLKCNRRKKNKSVLEFLEYLSGLSD